MKTLVHSLIAILVVTVTGLAWADPPGTQTPVKTAVQRPNYTLYYIHSIGNGTLVVHSCLTPTQFTVNTDEQTVVIRLDGTTGKLSDLKVGQWVKLYRKGDRNDSEHQQIVKIELSRGLAKVQEVAGTQPIEVFFSPKGGCTDAIIKELKNAKSSVLVQAYWFTSPSIAKALVEVHKRGVKVEVILDRSRTEMENEQAEFIVQNDVPTFIDDKHTTAHNKVIIIDGNVVITGSFNFTDQAENENAENLLVIRDKGIADKFTANWKAHAKHSGRYEKQVQR